MSTTFFFHQSRPNRRAPDAYRASRTRSGYLDYRVVMSDNSGRWEEESDTNFSLASSSAPLLGLGEEWTTGTGESEITTSSVTRGHPLTDEALAEELDRSLNILSAKTPKGRKDVYASHHHVNSSGARDRETQHQIPCDPSLPPTEFFPPSHGTSENLRSCDRQDWPRTCNNHDANNHNGPQTPPSPPTISDRESTVLSPRPPRRRARSPLHPSIHSSLTKIPMNSTIVSTATEDTIRPPIRPPKIGGYSKNDRLRSVEESWGPRPGGKIYGLFQPEEEPPSRSTSPFGILGKDQR